MTEPQSVTRGGWAYVSLVSAVPGLSTDDRSAVTAQFGVFEGTAIFLAAFYDLWQLLPLATTAIVISTIGSYLMVTLSNRIHTHNPPEAYRRIVFDSSIDIVMGLISFIALITYVLIDSQGSGVGLFDRVFGNPAPPAAVFFALFVAWDLTYRIGIGWWTSITGLWRTIAFHTTTAGNTDYYRTDLYTIFFAGLQLLLVPFLWPDRFLAFLIVGHVVAVFLVSGLSIGLQQFRKSN